VVVVIVAAVVVVVVVSSVRLTGGVMSSGWGQRCIRGRIWCRPFPSQGKGEDQACWCQGKVTVSNNTNFAEAAIAKTTTK